MRPLYAWIWRDLTEFWRSTKSVERLEYRAACLDRILMKPKPHGFTLRHFPKVISSPPSAAG